MKLFESINFKINPAILTVLLISFYSDFIFAQLKEKERNEICNKYSLSTIPVAFAQRVDDNRMLNKNPDSVLTVQIKGGASSWYSERYIGPGDGRGMRLSEFYKCRNLAFFSYESAEMITHVDFKQFPNLREVNIQAVVTSKNMDDLFTTAKDLRSLTLKYTPAPQMPESFFALKKLEYLAIPAGALRKLPVDCLKNFPNLRYLRISGADSITAAHIWNAQSLEVIEFYGGDLRYIPPAMGEMKHLKEIIIDSVRSVSFPPEIGKLQSLEWISIAEVENWITFPLEIRQLQSIKGFALKDASLTAYPEFHPDNELLYLSYTGVGKVINDNLDLTNLKHLKSLRMSIYFSGIMPKEFPKGLESATKIEDLRISGGQNIPQYFKQFNQLEYLYLGNCQSFEDMKFFYNLESLKYYAGRQCYDNLNPEELSQLKELKGSILPDAAIENEYDIISPFLFYPSLIRDRITLQKKY